jgi:hypothetical protein
MTHGTNQMVTVERPDTVGMFGQARPARLIALICAVQ